MIARLALVLLVLTGSGCRSTDRTGTLGELHRVRSGDLDVVLLSEDGPLKHDEDTFALEFRTTADGTLVDAGQVKAMATMPMPGMAPMVSDVSVERTGTIGRYAGTASLSMAGTWRITVEWDGPRGSGSAAFVPMIQ